MRRIAVAITTHLRKFDVIVGPIRRLLETAPIRALQCVTFAGFSLAVRGTIASGTSSLMRG
jgi:hypothetical protein